MIALQAWTRGLLVLPLVMCTLSIAIFPAHAQEPIKIGFSVSLTGGLASSGKAHLMSKQIWAEEINAKGGLLGRPVKLVYYDDQTNAAIVPGIYAKLIDVDKVDLLMGHATNLIVAAMPLIIERKKLVMVLLALGSNAEFKYSRYFQSAAFGPDSKGVLSNNFFEVAKSLKPEPKTVALVGADAEFSNNVLDRRARERQEIRPARSCTTAAIRRRPSTTRRSCAPSRRPIPTWSWSRPIRRIRSASCAPRPRSVSRPSCSAAPWSGMQYASLMQQLGDKLNRVVNYHLYVPSPKMSFAGIEAS